MTTLVVTDNPFALALAEELNAKHGNITIRQTPMGGLPGVEKIDVKSQFQEIIAGYDLVLSIHCKQLFPAALVKAVRCVNVHPGLNPFNRGWYPQVFSIMNGLKAGVTIHEMDELLDHGPIIVQREYQIEEWDTSGSAYQKIMALERELLLEYFQVIQNGNYSVSAPCAEGNVNTKKDFETKRQIDLEEVGKFGDFLNYLRAMTHDQFRNAYFLDAQGNRVYVRIETERVEGS